MSARAQGVPALAASQTGERAAGAPAVLQPVARLIPPTLRLLPWSQVAAAVTIAAIIVANARSQEWAGVGSISSGLRFAAAALALSAAFVLDDPAQESLAAMPVTLAARRLVRVLPVLAVLTAAWLGLVLFAASAGSLTGPQELPTIALSLEALVMLLVVLAGAGSGSRLGSDRSGGIAGGLALLGVLAVVPLLPQRLAIWVSADVSTSSWRDAHLRWAALGVFTFLLTAAASADPARRPILLRRRGHRAHGVPTTGGHPPRSHEGSS
jgi:hypothetical protein